MGFKLRLKSKKKDKSSSSKKQAKEDEVTADTNNATADDSLKQQVPKVASSARRTTTHCSSSSPKKHRAEEEEKKDNEDIADDIQQILDDLDIVDDDDDDNGNANNDNNEVNESYETQDTDDDDEPPPPPPPPYTIGDHCQHLHLKQSIHDSDDEAWYIDATQHYLPGHITTMAALNYYDFLQDLVQDFLQPYSDMATLKETHIGMTSAILPGKSTKGKEEQEPLPLRTVAIRLRPDASQEKILQLVQQIWKDWNPKYHIVLQETDEVYMGIGADGNLPMCLLANVVTHSLTLHRRLFLRFYHVHQLDLSRQEQETLVAIRTQYVDATFQERTPRQVQFTEASILVQFIKASQNQLQLSDEAPATNTQETSEWLKDVLMPSPSVCSVFRRTQQIFPALAKQDYGLWQLSFGIVDRIWLELSKHHFVYASLVLKDESARRIGFGKLQLPTDFGRDRVNIPHNRRHGYSTKTSAASNKRHTTTILDVDYCVQVATLSQRNMRRDLKIHADKITTALQETLQQYDELKEFLLEKCTEHYRVTLPKELNINLMETGQESFTKNMTMHIPTRDRDDCPWHQPGRDALQDLSITLQKEESTSNRLVLSDPAKYLKQVDRHVHSFLLALVAGDDAVQQKYLKDVNQRGMQEIQKAQLRCMKLLEALILLPQTHKHLKRVMSDVNDWYEISLHSKTSNTRRDPVPLWIFKTAVGQGCVTSHQLMLVSGVLTTQVYVYDWTQVELHHTPEHRLTKVAVMGGDGVRLNGFYPINTDIAKLVRICRTLKALQEAQCY